MKYYCKLTLRITLLLLISFFNLKLFYFLFSKLTFYLTYLTLFFYRPIISDSNLLIRNEVLEFIPACVAGSAYFLLALLILLTKDIKLKKGIYMFVLGSLLILIANILRLDLLIVIFVSYSKDLFSSLHMFFWKILSSIYVAFVWIFLVLKFRIKNIPIYSDILYLTKSLKRKKRNKII